MRLRASDPTPMAVVTTARQQGRQPTCSARIGAAGAADVVDGVAVVVDQMGPRRETKITMLRIGMIASMPFIRPPV